MRSGLSQPAPRSAVPTPEFMDELRERAKRYRLALRETETRLNAALARVAELQAENELLKRQAQYA